MQEFPIGAIVSHKDYTETFEVDSHNRGEYGIRERRINGLAMWAHPSELTLICACRQVSDGANGWRCETKH